MGKRKSPYSSIRRYLRRPGREFVRVDDIRFWNCCDVALTRQLDSFTSVKPWSGVSESSPAWMFEVSPIAQLWAGVAVFEWAAPGALLSVRVLVDDRPGDDCRIKVARSVGPGDFQLIAVAPPVVRRPPPSSGGFALSPDPASVAIPIMMNETGRIIVWFDPLPDILHRRGAAVTLRGTAGLQDRSFPRPQDCDRIQETANA